MQLTTFPASWSLQAPSMNANTRQVIAWCHTAGTIDDPIDGRLGSTIDDPIDWLQHKTIDCLVSYCRHYRWPHWWTPGLHYRWPHQWTPTQENVLLRLGSCLFDFSWIISSRLLFAYCSKSVVANQKQNRNTQKRSLLCALHGDRRSYLQIPWHPA